MKFVVEDISEAVAQETEPSGSCVAIVESGAFPAPADWAGRSLASAFKIADYKETAGQIREYLVNEKATLRTTRGSPLGL
jgi:hypothetical protein